MVKLYKCDNCNKVGTDYVSVHITHNNRSAFFDACLDCGKQVLRTFNPGASTFQYVFGEFK